MLRIRRSFVGSGTGPAHHHDDRDGKDNREREEIHHDSGKFQVVARKLVRGTDPIEIKVGLLHRRPPKKGIGFQIIQEKGVIRIRSTDGEQMEPQGQSPSNEPEVSGLFEVLSEVLGTRTEVTGTLTKRVVPILSINVAQSQPPLRARNQGRCKAL